MIRSWTGRWGLVLGLLLAGGKASAASLLVPAQYPTIQAAVDAAAPAGGDEIIVGAGLFEEQLVIDHDVTITGSGVGVTVLRAPLFMPYVSRPLDYNAVIHAQSPQGSVVLRDFTVDGAGRGRPSTRFTGIIFEQCGGVVERLEINNIHEPSVTNLNSGIGFYAASLADDAVQLRLEDVAINTYQKVGFACFGHGCELDLRNVVVDPTGFHSLTVQNGFELLNDTFGTMTNCTARLCWYGDTLFPAATSCGYLLYYGREWTIVDSVSDQNQSGFYCLATSVSMTGTEVTGYPEQLVSNYGIVTAGMILTQAGKGGIAQPVPLDMGEPVPTRDLGNNVSFNGCRLRGGNVPGSLGLLSLTDVGEVALELENCDIAQWEVGVVTLDTSGLVAGRARTCRLQDNLTQAVLAMNLHQFDARGNYWGDATGPFHPEANPGGLGDVVSDNVVIDPWLKGNLVCGPSPQYIALADADGGGYSREFTIRYLGGEGEPVYGYSTEVTWDQALLTASAADFSRPDAGLFQAAVLFQVLPIAGGFRVEAALGGDQAGVGVGELFKVRFHLVGEPQYVEVPVNLEVRHLRDSQNREIEGWVADDGLVIGDLMPPKFTLLKLTNTTLGHTDQFAKNGDLLRIDATAGDDDPLFGQTGFVGDLIYLFAGAGYRRPPDSCVDGAASWFATSAYMYPADGWVTYSISATDPAGNTAIASGGVTADNTAPSAVSGLAAVAGHNRIDVQWNPPDGLDANLRQVVLRSTRTGQYPTYPDPQPAYPASPTDGDPVYAGLGDHTTVTYAADGSQRDLVGFQAFAVDQVGLVSAAVAGSRGRAANYLLADVTAGVGGGYDGVTDIYDLTRLGDTFGLVGAQPDFNAECDVGPTSDGTDGGLPVPDGSIDLEDLMVFADRFDAFLHPTAAPDAAGGPAQVQLVWTRQEPGVWVLELVAPCPQLKAFRLAGAAAAGVSVEVRAGELLRRQAAPYFLHADPAGLDVCVAVLGRAAGLTGTGELLRVTTSRPGGFTGVALEARSVANASLVTSLAQEEKPAPLPTVFALHGNYPNPFNPATTIAFDLPSSQPVQLVVYGLDGRVVSRLLQGPLPAGRHEVVWRGRDDRERTVAAGVYLYRLEAGPWSASGKLNLVK